MRYQYYILCVFFIALFFPVPFSCGQDVTYPQFNPDLAELTEQQKETISVFFRNLKSTRESIYGNAHAVFNVVETEDTGKSTKRKEVKYEFWSKDHIFFRADSEIIASDDPEQIGIRRRMIVRPEGTANFSSKKAGAPLLVVSVERPETGYDGFTSMPFYQCSTLLNCLGGVALAEVLFLRDVNGVKKQLKHIEINKSACNCTVSCVTSGSPYDVDFSFNIDLGICLSLKGVRKEGNKVVYSREVLNEYDHSRFRQIPTKHIEKFKSESQGSSKTLEISTVSADFEPIDMEVFSSATVMQEKGQGLNFWTRRFLIFIVGSILFGAFLIYRFIFKNHAPA